MMERAQCVTGYQSPETIRMLDGVRWRRNRVPKLIIARVKCFSAADLHSQRRFFHTGSTNQQSYISNSDSSVDDDSFSTVFCLCSFFFWLCYLFISHFFLFFRVDILKLQTLVGSSFENLIKSLICIFFYFCEKWAQIWILKSMSGNPTAENFTNLLNEYNHVHSKWSLPLKDSDWCSNVFSWLNTNVFGLLLCHKVRLLYFFVWFWCFNRFKSFQNQSQHLSH